MSPVPAPAPAADDGATAESLGLGKYAAVGYPDTDATFFDPAATSYDDGGGWIARKWDPVGGAHIPGSTVTVGAGDPTADNHVLSVEGMSADAVSGASYVFSRSATADGVATDATYTLDAFLAADGSSGEINESLDIGPLSGSIRHKVHTDLCLIQVSAQDAQTTPLIQVYGGAPGYNEIFALGPNGSVGGVAPNVGDVIKWDGSKWIAGAP